MNAIQTVSPILLPLGRRLCAADWQRIARRRPTRADLVRVRRIIDQVQADDPCPAVEQVARAALPLVTRFLNAVPDLTYLMWAEECGITHVRCSRDVELVRELVRASGGVFVEQTDRTRCPWSRSESGDFGTAAISLSGNSLKC
jgi:hypothetical protein